MPALARTGNGPARAVPMREQVLWTNLTLGEIAQHLAQRGTAVSVTVVTQLLDEAATSKIRA